MRNDNRCSDEFVDNGIKQRNVSPLSLILNFWTRCTKSRRCCITQEPGIVSLSERTHTLSSDHSAFDHRCRLQILWNSQCGATSAGWNCRGQQLRNMFGDFGDAFWYWEGLLNFIDTSQAFEPTISPLCKSLLG
jgi:hypothetical protein